MRHAEFFSRCFFNIDGIIKIFLEFLQCDIFTLRRFQALLRCDVVAVEFVQVDLLIDHRVGKITKNTKDDDNEPIESVPLAPALVFRCHLDHDLLQTIRCTPSPHVQHLKKHYFSDHWKYSVVAMRRNTESQLAQRKCGEMFSISALPSTTLTGVHSTRSS